MFMENTLIDYLEEIQELITKYNKLIDEEIKEKEQELMQV